MSRAVAAENWFERGREVVRGEFIDVLSLRARSTHHEVSPLTKHEFRDRVMKNFNLSTAEL